MKFNWFRRFGILYIPVNIAGWIILLVAVAYAVYVFLDLDSRSHSVSDTMLNFVLNFLIIGAVYTLIAFFTGPGTLNKETEEKKP